MGDKIEIILVDISSGKNRMAIKLFLGIKKGEKKYSVRWLRTNSTNVERRWSMEKTDHEGTI